MTLKELDSALLSKGFTKSVVEKREVGTKMHKTIYECIRNNPHKIAIVILKVGRSRSVISLYYNWNLETKTGKCNICDTTPEKVMSILEDNLGDDLFCPIV